MVIAVAALVEKLVWPFIPPSPTLLFYPAVLVVARTAGFGPSILSVGLSLLPLAYWFLPPYGSFTVERSDDVLDLVIFAGMAVMLSTLIDRLQRSEAKARGAVESTPAATVLLSSDGTILSANPAFVTILGYQSSELRNRSIRHLVYSADLHGFEEALAELKEKEKEVLVSSRYTAKNNYLVYGEGTLSSLSCSGPERYLLQFVDATKRKEAEREREHVLVQLRAVVDECPVGLVILRDGGRVVESNAAGLAIYGRKMPSAMDGVLTEAVFDDEGRPLTPDQRPSVRALRGERISGLEIQMRRPDGLPISLLVNAAPMAVSEEDQPAAVVVFQDISPIKELECLRTQWNAVVAHDLRQPLNSILLRTQLLARKAAKNDDTEDVEEVQAILRAARRLNCMVQDLLDASRLEVRQLPLKRREVDVVALVTERVLSAQRETPESKYELAVSDTNVVASADPDRLSQILENLLSNAGKYGTPSRPIGIAVGKENGNATISVSNEGEGIPPNELPHLFERFKRMESSVRSGITGTGLGLYIVRELVAAHQGEIKCTSQLGGTTTFRVTFPLREASVAQAAPN